MPIRAHSPPISLPRALDVPCPPAPFRGRPIPKTSTRIVVALALLATLPACQPPKDRTAPDEIVGVWTTSEPRYADRFLEITRESIIIGTGQGEAQTHPISTIRHTREDKAILYTISYVNPDGEEGTLSFYYDARPEGTIRLKNQKQIRWAKGRR